METSTQIMKDTARSYLANIDRTLDRIERRGVYVLFVYSGDHCYLMDFSTKRVQVIEVKLN